MSISSTGGSSANLMSWLITHNKELNRSLDDAMHQGDLNVTTEKELKDILDHMKDVTQYGYGNVADDMNKFIANHSGDPDCGAVIGVLTKMSASYAKGQSDFASGADPTSDVADCPEGLQNEIDSMKKLDDLQMTRINDLSSQRGQDFQLVSNLMASTNQVLSGMINNLKG